MFWSREFLWDPFKRNPEKATHLLELTLNLTLVEGISNLFGTLRIPHFVNNKEKDVNSDWLADQWDERSVLGHARIHKGRMKGDDPEIDTAQTPKRFDECLAVQEKIRKTFTDSIPNKYRDSIAPLALVIIRGA